MSSSVLTYALRVVLQFELLALLTPTQAAELTLSSGALNSTNQINAVFDRLEEGNAFKNVDEFLTALSVAPEASQSVNLSDTGRMEATYNKAECLLQVPFKLLGFFCADI